MEEVSRIQDHRLMVVAIVVAVVTGAGVYGIAKLVWLRISRHAVPRAERRAYQSIAALCLLGCAAFVYALAIEPRWLDVTHTSIKTSKLAVGQRLRIVALADLHVARDSALLGRVVRAVNEAHPDLVVFLGDALNASAGRDAFRETLSRMNAPEGRYAVQGNHDAWYWHRENLFGGGVATELSGTPVPILGGRVVLCGAAYGSPGRVEGCLESASPEAFSIAAYHTPDLVEDLRPVRPDLYLAGHTHGGQVRLPFYGAVVTLSRFDKKYEAGLYQVGPTALYVNRGIGEEPEAPAVRFLCRPEVTVIDLEGTASP